MGFDLKRSLLAALSMVLVAGGASAVEPKTVAALVSKSSPDRSLFKPAEGETKNLPGGAELTLSPGTEISRLPSIRLQLGGGGKTPTHVFRVSNGRVDVSIPPAQANKIAVLLVGPGGNSSVAAQGHMTAVLRSDAVSFTAFDAEMLTGRGSQWRKLRAGGSRAFDLKRGSTVDTPMLPAPRVVPESSLGVSLDGRGFGVNVEVGGVRQAASYQVALVRREGPSVQIVDQVEAQQGRARLRGDQPGQYTIVARALNEYGVEGQVSSPKTLRVLGVQLPEGATANDSSVVLRPHQRLSLVATDGIEMTYGRGDYFVGAPPSVGMSRGASTLVRFRDPQSKAEVSLTMIPRHVRAKMSLGPKSARWPRDRVEVRVELVDDHGAPVAPDGEIEATVTVNLEPTPVEWRQKDNVLTATVPRPKDGDGPWVVRVEVKQADGRSLGRDFLEVAK